MKTIADLERRTAEYAAMLRQIHGGAAGGPGPAAITLTTGGDSFEQVAFLTALDRLAAEPDGAKRRSTWGEGQS